MLGSLAAGALAAGALAAGLALPAQADTTSADHADQAPAGERARAIATSPDQPAVEGAVKAPASDGYDSTIVKQGTDGTVTVEYYKDGKLVKTDSNPAGIGFETR
jgi:hypothetical protein